MMYWYGHGMSAWGYAWMGIGTVVFWVLVIGGIVIAVRFAFADRDRPSWPSSPSAQDLLAERFARGEIDETEYANRLAALRSSGAAR